LLVLSFSTTHALTDCLLAADAHAETLGWGSAPALVLLRDRPMSPAGARQLRQMRAAAFTLPRQAATEGIPGITQILQDLAANLDHARAAASDRGLDVDIAGDLIGDREPGTRLLAWAVLYQALLQTPAGARQIRRVDAIDIDGRVYQVSRLRGEALAVVIVDDQPDPCDLPATHSGLAALLSATAQLARHARYGAH
jgi:hypothetical protein